MVVFRSDATVLEQSSKKTVRVRVHRATWKPVIRLHLDEG